MEGQVWGRAGLWQGMRSDTPSGLMGLEYRGEARAVMWGATGWEGQESLAGGGHCQGGPEESRGGSRPGPPPRQGHPSRLCTWGGVCAGLQRQDPHSPSLFISRCCFLWWGLLAWGSAERELCPSAWWLCGCRAAAESGPKDQEKASSRQHPGVSLRRREGVLIPALE